MLDWITEHKIPLGVWLRNFVDQLTTHGQSVFDGISLVLGSLIDGLTSTLSLIPPLVFILLVAGGAWLLHRSLALAGFAIVSLLLIVNLGYWTETIRMKHLPPEGQPNGTGPCVELLGREIGVDHGLDAIARPVGASQTQARTVGHAARQMAERRFQQPFLVAEIMRHERGRDTGAPCDFRKAGRRETDIRQRIDRGFHELPTPLVFGAESGDCVCASHGSLSASVRR